MNLLLIEFTVISNNIFSNKDMIKHGVNGFIYE